MSRSAALLSGRRIPLVLAVLAFSVMLSGWLNARQKRRHYAEYLQVGRSVRVNGRSMNIYCSGIGEPTVIFETFSHQAGYSWSGVQPHVAKFSRACWYDRAGYGWSDDGTMPRTFRATAQDLHALLTAAAISGPYVFVGAYDATAVIRVYNGLYATDLAGAVFIDGNDVDVYAHRISVPKFLEGPWQREVGTLAPYARGAFCFAYPVVSPVLQRLPKLRPLRRTLSYGLPANEQQKLDFLSDRAFGESCDVEHNVADVETSGRLGSRPLIVLASAHQQVAGRENAKAASDWNAWWLNVVQSRLVALSTQARLIVVDERVDWESIVSAVREVVDDVRRPPPRRGG